MTLEIFPHRCANKYPGSTPSYQANENRCKRTYTRIIFLSL
nr:MAG TPA: hypothetical protein [Caudoviricetes sp.]